MINAAPIANQPNPFTPSTPEPVSQAPSAPSSSIPAPKSPIKKKPFNLKLILGLVILLFVVVGSVAAYLLMQTSQDVRQQAAVKEYTCTGECMTIPNKGTCSTVGLKSASGTCQAGTKCCQPEDPGIPVCPANTTRRSSATDCSQFCSQDCIAALNNGAKVCCPNSSTECSAGQVKGTEAQSCQGMHLYSYACEEGMLAPNGSCQRHRVDHGVQPLGACISLTPRTIPGYSGCVWTQYDLATTTGLGDSNCGAWWASTCGGGGGKASPTPVATPTNNPTPPASQPPASQPPTSSKPSVPPTSPPVGPQCISIKKNIADPGIGDNVVFTCGAVKSATEYRFRVTEPDGTVKTLKATGRVSAAYKVAKSGRHYAQCTICYQNSANKNTCIPWESLK